MSAWMLWEERMLKMSGELRSIQDIATVPGLWLQANGIVWHATAAWRWVMKWEVCPFVSVPPVEVKGRSLSWYCSKIKWLEWDGGGTKSTQSRSFCLPKEAQAGPRVPLKVLSFAGLDGKDSGSLEFGVIFSYLRMQWLILNSCLSVYYQCWNQCSWKTSFSEQRAMLVQTFAAETKFWSQCNLELILETETCFYVWK